MQKRNRSLRCLGNGGLEILWNKSYKWVKNLFYQQRKPQRNRHSSNSNDQKGSPGNDQTVSIHSSPGGQRTTHSILTTSKTQLTLIQSILTSHTMRPSFSLMNSVHRMSRALSQIEKEERQCLLATIIIAMSLENSVQWI